jgi:hypothetical protein
VRQWWVLRNIINEGIATQKLTKKPPLILSNKEDGWDN